MVKNEQTSTNRIGVVRTSCPKHAVYDINTNKCRQVIYHPPLNCTTTRLNESEYYITSDGRLYLNNTQRFLNQSEFTRDSQGIISICVNNGTNNISNINGISKYSVAESYITLVGLVISIPALAITIIVYLCIPDLRTLPGRPSQERHTANSYSIWRTRNQDSRPYLDENKLANVRRDILRNNRLTDSEKSAIKHATENDINIRHKGNEESDEQYCPLRGLIERLPYDQSTQRPEDTRNSIVPVKDSQENDKITVTEDLAFAEEHRESMAEMRQKILNTFEVVRHTAIGGNGDCCCDVRAPKPSLDIDASIIFGSIYIHTCIYVTLSSRVANIQHLIPIKSKNLNLPKLISLPRFGMKILLRPSQERHTANSYSIWRTRNQDSRPYLDENKLANVMRDILRNNRLTNTEISAIKHATENDINIRHKGNEESDEQYSPPRGLIERLPSDQSTQRPEDTRNSIVPVEDSQENDKTTVTEDFAFAEEHRESMAEMRQKILNTLEVQLYHFIVLDDEEISGFIFSIVADTSTIYEYMQPKYYDSIFNIDGI
ncbi:Hypothetical predicted protein [Octopus vulgaris]|uniref:Uncharacterized protein n=1 Tax=Octopus vulgaris TaxID=6645 RepID=A0AA36F7S0_OCTVU|nr:Hypothetical predicted protein [Octopus vulgaris]